MVGIQPQHEKQGVVIVIRRNHQSLSCKCRSNDYAHPRAVAITEGASYR